jgi:hypothetical protein
MIRIWRSPNVPAEILTHGPVRRQEHEAAIDADPGSSSAGSATLTFDPAVYAHTSVKQALITMQYQKCAFCACERCNRRHKKNLFPLADPARRARTHRDPLGDETPVFIDPSMEDPERYISYREHIPIAIGGNPRGEQTIKALGLDRPELNADREEHLERLKLLHATAANPAVPDELRTKARTLLAKATSDEAEYALMCRVELGALGVLPSPRQSGVT